MLTQLQIEEFRKFLKESKNPLFFFDGDPDGLCSYLIFKKYIQKGKGAILKGVKTLSLDQFYKVDEYNPDTIFALDIANIDQEFIDRCSCPILWLDHHEPEKRNNVHYFNPILNKKEPVPTSYMAY